MLEISLNMYHAVALGAFLFWLGGVITSKISLLNRYCIPAPLVGGLCFSIVNCILYSTGAASITFDDTLQSVFMIMFFTTVGFTVSIPALLKGGKAVLLCLLVAVVMIPVQNFLGGGVMALFGKDPLLGIGCGSIALVGGPGTAAAYGPELEAAGAVGGSVVSIAAATFGLVAGSLMGGPTARRLINKYGLRPDSASLRASAPSAEVLATDVASEDETFSSSSPRFVKGFMVLLLAVGIGSQVSAWLTALTRLTFPGYIGAMLVAVVVRNVMDGMKVEYPAEEIDTMGNMFLSIFLAIPGRPEAVGAGGPGPAHAPLPRRPVRGDGAILLPHRVPGHGPQLRRGGDDRRLHRLLHGRHLQRHGQYAGGHQEVRPLPRGLLCHPHGGRNVHRLLQRGAHHLQHRALGPLTQGSGYIPPVSSRERPPTVRGPLPAAFSPPPQARAPGFSAGLSCFSGPFRV